MHSWHSLHPIQIGVLHALTFRVSGRFSELKTQHVTSDRFSFHLKKLQEMGLIEHDRTEYRLTNLGKGVASQFGSAQEKESGRHARVGVLIGCVQINARGEKEYLIQQRLKHPFYGCHGFMASKVQWGETPEQAAQRGLSSEQGVQAKLTLVGVKHKMDYAQDTTLLEDKYFFVFRGEDVTGRLISQFEGGKNFWASQQDIINLPNLYGGVMETLAMIDNSTLTFKENAFTISNY